MPLSQLFFSFPVVRSVPFLCAAGIAEDQALRLFDQWAVPRTTSAVLADILRSSGVIGSKGGLGGIGGGKQLVSQSQQHGMGPGLGLGGSGFASSYAPLESKGDFKSAAASGAASAGGSGGIELSYSGWDARSSAGGGGAGMGLGDQKSSAGSGVGYGSMASSSGGGGGGGALRSLSIVPIIMTKGFDEKQVPVPAASN
jgi:hypothetical protein